MFEYFTDKAIQAVMLAQEEARRSGHNLVGSEQLLLGLIGVDTGIASQILSSFGVTLENARIIVDQIRGRGPGYAPANIPFTPKVKRIFEQALQESRQLGHRSIGPEHILLALTQTRDSVANKVLIQLGVDIERIRTQLIERLSDATASATPVGARVESPNKLFGGSQTNKPKLAEFSTNFTELAKAGKLDPVVGRETEIERVVQILGRRTKNNPVLVGEPGVGKTAIAEGLAQRIVMGDVPELIQDKQVMSLDMGSLVSGTRFRGDFEERLEAIIKEVREAGNIILVIDEIHTLVGAGGIQGGIDAANMLKPALARGELQCLGATTLNEYRKHIEQDAALERRFQKVMVGEPSVTETQEILVGLRPTYEEFHQVTISDEAIEAAAKLSYRYISDRFLPDKAIDLIDEAGSRVHLRSSQQQKAVISKPDESLESDLWNSQEIEQLPVVDEEEIAQIVAAWTGIPVTKMTKPESEIILHLEARLHERVIGQNEAVTAVARAVRRARAGIKDPNRPIASFIFSGPTGVGKTELAKALANYMFGSDDAMIRVDMSEFMEPHTISKLIGSPPGFVGYDEGGQLTEAVRRQPYTVVLFDEIEKAHPDVFNIMLQLLDDGHLTDSQGRRIDFKNTIVIMTSNLGSKVIEKGGGGLGFDFADNEDEANYDRIRSRVNDELKQYFRPEFLNRLDEVIVFRQLKQEEVSQIADILLKEISDRLMTQREIALEVTEAFKEHVVTEGFDPSYGARPLRRAIMRFLEDSLAEAILTGQIKDGDRVQMDLDDGKVKVLPIHNKELLLVG